MERRGFLKLSGTAAAAVVVAPSLITETLRADDGSMYKSYGKVMLKDKDGNPLKSANLVKEESYIFHYPYVSTTNILVDIGEATKKNVHLTAEDGTKYVFKGGVGSKGSVSAYSTICPHAFSHVSKGTSFFRYVKTTGTTAAMKPDGEGVFVCSAHLSSFSVKEGGKGIGGPVLGKQNLAQIVLEIDKDDVIWAVGVLGQDKFQEYLSSYKDEFKKYYGNKRKAKKLLKVDYVETITLKNFTEQEIAF